MSKIAGSGAGGSAGRGGRGGAVVTVTPVPAPKPSPNSPVPNPAPQAPLQAIPAPVAASQRASSSPNAAAATKLVEYALRNEPPLTQDVVATAQSIGANLEGLANRVKTIDSTARKLQDVAGNVPPSTSGRTVGQYINDGLRYTMTIPEATYTSSVQAALRSLQQQGFSVTYTKNFWNAGNTYKGVNVDMERAGIRIEMQFHTPASYQLKQGTLDSLYQKYRVETDPNVRAQLKQQMVTASSGLTQPNNTNSLGAPIRNFR